MLKKLVIFLLAALLSFTGLYVKTAESRSEAPEEKTAVQLREKPQFDFDMNFLIGISSYRNIDGNQIAFQRFSFLPEFSYGKWGLGLDFTFDFDGDFRLRDLNENGKPDGWTSFDDYLRKISYVRYGFRGEPVYGRIGSITDYTFGHGLIMDGYNNTLYYPVVIQPGLDLEVDGTAVDFPFVGVQTLVSDVLDWDIMGMRLYVRPLANVKNPLVSAFTAGATVVTDRDPQESPLEYTEDNPASESVTEFGLDAQMPLMARQDSSLVAYADWAKISGKGSGGLIGSRYTYRWLQLIAQLGFYGKQFAPSYFDAFYERDRATEYASLDEYDEFSLGYLAGTRMDIMGVVFFYFTVEGGFTGPLRPRVQTGVGTAENALPKLSVSLMYDKKNIDSIEEFFSEEDSLMQLEVTYRASPGAAISFIYGRTYSVFTPDVTAQTLVETRFSF